jgi:hypothetical protein
MDMPVSMYVMGKFSKNMTCPYTNLNPLEKKPRKCIFTPKMGESEN